MSLCARIEDNQKKSGRDEIGRKNCLGPIQEIGTRGQQCK